MLDNPSHETALLLLDTGKLEYINVVITYLYNCEMNDICYEVYEKLLKIITT